MINQVEMRADLESGINDPLFAPTRKAVARQVQELRSSAFSLDERFPNAWKPLRRSISSGYVRHATEHARRDGRAAIVMAGAPGAGKSTALRGLPSGPRGIDLPNELEHYIVVDADEVKTLLLGDPVPGIAVDDDLLTSARSHWQSVIEQRGVMPDGAPLMRGELATLVHRASLVLHTEIRGRLFSQGFNTVVEGTLGWTRDPNDPEHNPGQGLTLARELRVHQYERVDFFAVDAPLDLCQRQALMRWWDGRKRGLASPGSPGGRFTPAEDIAGYFDVSGTNSRCIANAYDTYGLEEVQEAFHRLTLTIVDRHGPDATTRQWVSGSSDESGVSVA